MLHILQSYTTCVQVSFDKRHQSLLPRFIGGGDLDRLTLPLPLLLFPIALDVLSPRFAGGGDLDLEYESSLLLAGGGDRDS